MMSKLQKQNLPKIKFHDSRSESSKLEKQTHGSYTIEKSLTFFRA